MLNNNLNLNNIKDGNKPLIKNGFIPKPKHNYLGNQGYSNTNNLLKPTNNKNNRTNNGFLKQKIHQFVEYLKNMEGDPHYISMGMAIGIFVSFTPTIPFQMVIAVTIATFLNGSKAAAAIGVWFSNPLNLPLFYLGSYKTGVWLFEKKLPFNIKFQSVSELIELGLDATFVMIVGGIVLGIIPSIIAYFITKKIVTAIHEKRFNLKSLHLDKIRFKKQNKKAKKKKKK
ncbi:MAG: DUF2062 domain-containing protein [Desulfobacterales bacterium]|nr:DUF2062 domain-containing protein [Desulfobacterales bacterium]